MAKLGDELTVMGVTYVLVDASLFKKLSPGQEMLCDFCALDPNAFLSVCLNVDCDINDSGSEAVYVKKLEVNHESGR